MILLSLTLELDTVSPWNDGLTTSLLVTVGASATEGFNAPAWGILIRYHLVVTPTKRPVYILLVSWLSVAILRSRLRRLEASFGRARKSHWRKYVWGLASEVTLR